MTIEAADATLLDVGKVKSLREGLGLTQEQAAIEAGFKSRQAWNNIESGRQSAITLATLAKLAKMLKVEARDLLLPGPAAEIRPKPAGASKPKVPRRRKTKG